MKGGISISQLYPLHGKLYIDSPMQKIEKIARNYGYDAQSRQCIEEMAELTQAINKFWRNQLKCGDVDLSNIPFGTSEENNIEEELADVQIMIWQMKCLHKISDLEFEKNIERKLNRQIDRMEEENAD